MRPTKRPLFPLLALGLGCTSTPGPSASGETTSSSGSSSAATAGDSTATPTSSTAETAGADTSGPFDPTFSTLTDDTAADPVCGDGKVEGDEACDDGVNDGSYGGCLPTCTDLGPHCGDGVIQENFEDCDAGGRRAVPECNLACRVPGSILQGVTEVFETANYSPFISGVRVVEQAGELVAVFGGGSTTYWRLDRETLSTNDVITTTVDSVDAMIFNLRGLADLGGTELLVAGDGLVQAFAVSDDLSISWTWQTQGLPTPNAGFVGAARLPNGAILGGADTNHNQAMQASSYWAEAVSSAGNVIWSQIDTVVGDDDVYGRDLRGLSTGDAVLLTDGVDGGATFRLFNALGQTLITQELPALGGYQDLCVGENGFYVYDDWSFLLAGFDNAGQPTANVVAPALAAWEYSIGSSCAARADNSPFIAFSVTGNGSESLRMLSFDQDQVAWTVSVQYANGMSSFEEPFVFIDESRNRALVFFGGSVEGETNTRFVSVFSMAI